MQFGLAVFGSYPDDRPPTENFKTALEQVIAARESGFDLVWLGHHFLMPEQSFQPVPSLARMAPEAGEMYLGANVLVPLLSPVAVAENFATLDVLSEGRVVLGPIGGYRDVEFSSFGVDRASIGARVVEAVEVITSLWTEDQVTYDGEFVSLDGVSIRPQPVQDPRPPVWVGANADPAVERTTDIGDAWLMPGWERSDELDRQRRLAGDPAGGGLHGCQPFISNAFVAETDEVAFDVYRPYLQERYEWYEEAGQGDAMASENALRDFTPDHLLVGSPDTVANRLISLHERWGVDLVILNVHKSGLAHDRVLNAIELLGDTVMPQVAERLEH